MLDYIASDPQGLAGTLHAAARPAGGQRIDAVALVAVDALAVSAAIEVLHESGIAVITLVSDAAPSRRLHCIGVDNLAAGRLALSRVGRLDAGRRGRVTQVMQQDYPHSALLPAAAAPDDEQRAAQLTAPGWGAPSTPSCTSQVSDEVTVAAEALTAASDDVAGHVPAPIRIDIFLRDNIS